MKKRLISSVAVLLLAAMLSSCAGLQTMFGGSGKPTESRPPPTSAPSVPIKPPDPSPSKTPDASKTPDTDVSKTPDASPEETDKAPVVVSIVSDKFDHQTKYIETTVELPRITGLADAGAQSKINAVFKDYMVTVKKSNTASEAESKQMFDEGMSDAAYVIGVSYSVPYNRDGVLCILLSDYRYLGGAHGGNAWISYTFDTATGKQLSLGDLMKTGSAYRPYINGVIRKEIDKRSAAGELDEIATFSDIGDDPAFYLSSEGLVFYFQEYEYFPYSAGIQQFAIPYGDMTKLLNEKFTALEIQPVKLRPNVKNTLKVGDIGNVLLDGNTTTGYTWLYEISDPGVVELANQDYLEQNPSTGAVGTGGTFTWDFRALKPGTATITFSYTQPWDDSASAAPAKTARFTVTVR